MQSLILDFFPTAEEYDTGLRVTSPDFNGDGKVDTDDLLILIDNWGINEPLRGRQYRGTVSPCFSLNELHD
jgi:uncharacterized protein (DUF2141 family)